jgi:hypothetical protein
MLKPFFLSLFCLFSCSLAANQIAVSDFTVREFIPGTSSTVAYFELQNNSDKDHVLTSVDIKEIGRVEIHNHTEQDGMMHMVKLDSVKVAANSSIKFQTGGLHLMLFEPKQPLTKGQTVEVHLNFASGAPVKANAKVVGLALEQSHTHHHHH